MSSSLTKQDYIEYIKLQLTAGIIELEIEDAVIGKFVDLALSEVLRYLDQSIFVTVPYAKSIDLEGFNHSSILHVYRAQGLIGDTISTTDITSQVDPMYAQKWTIFSNGGMNYNIQNYVMNYASYSTLTQMQNTLTTDLNFIEDKSANKLYINCPTDLPRAITIEYVPVIKNVEEITSDYWIDILKRLSLALVKIALGRVRTRFTQSNALWTQDGETMLQEGNEELKELRETLRVNSMLFLPKD